MANGPFPAAPEPEVPPLTFDPVLDGGHDNACAMVSGRGMCNCSMNPARVAMAKAKQKEDDQ